MDGPKNPSISALALRHILKDLSRHTLLIVSRVSTVWRREAYAEIKSRRYNILYLSCRQISTSFAISTTEIPPVNGICIVQSDFDCQLPVWRFDILIHSIKKRILDMNIRTFIYGQQSYPISNHCKSEIQMMSLLQQLIYELQELHLRDKFSVKNLQRNSFLPNLRVFGVAEFITFDDFILDVLKCAPNLRYLRRILTVDEVNMLPTSFKGIFEGLRISDGTCFPSFLRNKQNFLSKVHICPDISQNSCFLNILESNAQSLKVIAFSSNFLLNIKNKLKSSFQNVEQIEIGISPMLCQQRHNYFDVLRFFPQLQNVILLPDSAVIEIGPQNFSTRNNGCIETLNIVRKSCGKHRVSIFTFVHFESNLTIFELRTMYSKLAKIFPNPKCVGFFNWMSLADSKIIRDCWPLLTSLRVLDVWLGHISSLEYLLFGEPSPKKLRLSEGNDNLHKILQFSELNNLVIGVDPRSTLIKDGDELLSNNCYNLLRNWKNQLKIIIELPKHAKIEKYSKWIRSFENVDMIHERPVETLCQRIRTLV